MLTKMKTVFKLWMKAADHKSLTDGDYERFLELVKLKLKQEGGEDEG